MTHPLLLPLLACTLANAQTDEEYSANYPESGVVVITRDTDGDHTNIRAAAGGRVACTVSTDSLFTFVFQPGMQEVNGWIRIPGDCLYWYDDTDAHSADDRDYTLAGHRRRLTGSTTGYWIHNSVLRLMLLPDEPIRREPKPDAATVWQSSLLANLRPIRMERGWVKVRTLDGKYTGWVEESSIIQQALLYNTDCSCGEGYEDTMSLWYTINSAYRVNGGAGIRQFVDAMGLADPEYPFEDDCYDARNGYFHFGEEGDGHCRYEAALWNRQDGRKLFVFSFSRGGECMDYESGEWQNHEGSTYRYQIYQDGPDRHYYYEDCGYQAYLYDPVKKQLVPLQDSPFHHLPPTTDCRFYELPQVGKDIRIRQYDYTHPDAEPVYHTLKWNGMSFDYVE